MSLGDKIFPIETKGMFDVHSYEDIIETEKWLKNNKKLLRYL